MRGEDRVAGRTLIGEIMNFPKAKRPIPAGHEGGEQPDLRALALAALVRLGKRAPCGASDNHDGDTPDAP